MKNCQRPQKTSVDLNQLRGFTLVELMITIAVMAILAALAAPSFNDALLGNKLGSYANNLVASAYTARSEAIKRNAIITLCASTDGATCATTGGWEQGWIVMCNTNDNATCNTAGTNTIVMLRQSSTTTGFLVTGLTTGTSTVIRSVTFQPSGIDATPATLTACRATPNTGKVERVVSISASGRPSVAKTAAGVCT